MRKRFFGLIFIALTLVLLVPLFLSESKYQARQVKSLPEPVTGSPMLTFPRHIRHSRRPAETASFPIAIGDVGPATSLYAGDNQYPFFCMTVDSDLGQPQVDNQVGWGVPVYATDTDIGNEKAIIGHSKDCGYPTQLRIIGETSQGQYQVISSNTDTATLGTFEHVYRVELGSINRFIYVLIMPIQAGEIAQRTGSEKWNKRLIYQFFGGTGIGFRQGRLRYQKLLEMRKAQLHQGYAVIASIGNKTSYTYNMLLAEDTARRVKRQFVSLYGEPLYTVGIGGSGGGLAQYLLGQNSQGIIDAALPLYSYPDMVSQTLYALDCDLLNTYYTYRSREPLFWQDWQNRQLIEGLNAANGDTHPSSFMVPINRLFKGLKPVFQQGNSECIEGFFGLSTFLSLHSCS